MRWNGRVEPLNTKGQTTALNCDGAYYEEGLRQLHELRVQLLVHLVQYESHDVFS